MDNNWVRDYLEKYLEIHQCQITESKQSHITVKLSEEVDKDITNRPYYWTFVERTGAEPETLTMTFIFDKDAAASKNLRGEEISLGTPKLDQFFAAAKKRGKIVRLYQQSNNETKNKATKLNPWLGANYKIEFICDKKKDLLISLGINLINGKMQSKFYNLIKNYNLTPVLPPNIITEKTFISFREAALQLEEWIIHEIYKEKFDWIYNANERLDEELRRIEDFYSNINEEDKSVEKEKRIEELRWQYSPKVDVKPINYGIFYLEENILNSVEYLN